MYPCSYVLNKRMVDNLTLHHRFLLVTPLHDLYDVLLMEWTGMQSVTFRCHFFFLIVSFEIGQMVLK